jgi:hypothetical protein
MQTLCSRIMPMYSVVVVVGGLVQVQLREQIGLGAVYLVW